MDSYDLLQLLASRLGLNGDPEGQGAAAASTAMEPAVTNHFQGISQGLLDWSAQQQAMHERLNGLPLAQQLADPEYRQSGMNAAMAFMPGAGLAMRGARAIESAVPALTAEQIATRIAKPVQQGFPDIQYGAGATSSTPAYQQIRSSNYGAGGPGSWIGRSSRFGDEDLANVGYNPRFDQSIYPGGQVKPPPGNPLLQENFTPQETTYSASYAGNQYGPNTLPPAIDMPNARYDRYLPQNQIPYNPPPQGMTPGQLNQIMEEYAGRRLNPDYLNSKAGANGNNSADLASALRNLLYAQKLWGGGQ